jgi:anti-anti-sigma factor
MPATVELIGNLARISLSGKLDFSTQKDVYIAIDEVLASGLAREIQVDLADVTFMDSSIIQALLSLQEKANAAAKSVTLVNCNNTLREIFAIGGFDTVFTIR